MRSLIATATGCCFFLGCYAYTPLPISQNRATGAVRITLTPAAYSQTYGTLGSQISAVEGDVRAADDSSVTISVTEVARPSLDEERFHGEMVTIPRRDIASLDSRHVNAAKSLTLTGLILGGAIWIAASLGNGAVNQVRQKGPSGTQ